MRREWWRMELIPQPGFRDPLYHLDSFPFRATEAQARARLDMFAFALARAYRDMYGYSAVHSLSPVAVHVVAGESSELLSYSFVLALKRLLPGEALFPESS